MKVGCEVSWFAGWLLAWLAGELRVVCELFVIKQDNL